MIRQNNSHADAIAKDAAKKERTTNWCDWFKSFQLYGLDDVRVAQVIQMGINLFHSVGLILQARKHRLSPNFKLHLQNQLTMVQSSSIILSEADSSSILPFSLDVFDVSKLIEKPAQRQLQSQPLSAVLPRSGSVWWFPWKFLKSRNNEWKKGESFVGVYKISIKYL